MQVYFENPFCSLFALAIDVAKILLAALNARQTVLCPMPSVSRFPQVLHSGLRPTAFLSARWSVFLSFALPAIISSVIIL